MAILPIREAIVRSVAHVVRRPGLAWRTARGWYGIQSAIMLLGLALAGPVDTETTELSGSQALFLILTMAAELVGMSAVAVNWHRITLLGEPAPERLRLPWQTWHYLWASLVLSIQVGIAAVIALWIASSFLPVFDDTHAVGWDLAFVSLAGAFIVGITGMALPAAAVGAELAGGSAISMVGRNFWRSGLAVLALGAMTILPTLFVTGIALKVHGPLGNVVNIVLGNAVAYAGVVLFASLLSHLYVFFDGRGPNKEVLNI